MSDVSIIGLGDMGAALARTLLRHGHSVTVWNRTPTKAEALTTVGAVTASTLAAAIAASPVSILCVADYTVSRGLLDKEETITALAGKTLIELSTGTPQEARNADVWTRERGAEYLDGAIFATPNQIGDAETTILISGRETSYQLWEPILRLLAGNLKYVGEPVGAAAAWDLAFLSHVFGGAVGFLQGVRIFESEGMPVAAYGNMIAEIAPLVGGMIQHEAEVIVEGDFSKPQSNLQTCSTAMDLLLKQAKESGIHTEFPEFISGYFKKGITAGYGKEEFGALIKVLRTA